MAIADSVLNLQARNKGASMRNLRSLLVVFLLASPALARDIFVDNQSGDDTLEGRAPTTQGRENGPVKTIAKATRLARPGDRIVLAKTSDPYREMVTLQAGNCSGFGSGSPLIFDGSGATLDGATPVADEAWENLGHDLFRFQPTIKSHQVLLGEEENAFNHVAVPRGSSLPQLKPLDWCLHDGWIYLRVQPGQVPQQYHASCAGLSMGITLYDVQHVVVKNVVVRGFAFDGLNAHDNAFDVRLEEVTSRENGRSGISIGGASQVRIIRCEAQGNLKSQLRSEGYSQTRYSDCKFDDGAAPALVRDGGEILED
jgi:hypothetical protein